MDRKFIFTITSHNEVVAQSIVTISQAQNLRNSTIDDMCEDWMRANIQAEWEEVNL